MFLLKVSKSLYFISVDKRYTIYIKLKKRCRIKSINSDKRYEPLDFWDSQKRASILRQGARFLTEDNTRYEAII